MHNQQNLRRFHAGADARSIDGDGALEDRRSHLLKFKFAPLVDMNEKPLHVWTAQAWPRHSALENMDMYGARSFLELREGNLSCMPSRIFMHNENLFFTRVANAAFQLKHRSFGLCNVFIVWMEKIFFSRVYHQ